MSQGELESHDVKRGKPLDQWTCRANSANQIFEICSDSFGQHKNQIIHSATGLCVDIWGWSQSNLADLALWDCHGGNNQLWRLQNVKSINYVYSD